MKALRCDIDDLAHCCGVSEIGGFGYSGYQRSPERIRSGTGLAIATFNDSPQSREAYKWLKEHFQILYQSEAYPNAVHSDRTNVFLVVYKVNREKVDYDDNDDDGGVW